MNSPLSEKAWQEIDWNQPIDPQAYLSITPPGHSVRGMFFQDLYKQMGEEHPPDRRYIAFKNYPLEDWMRLVAKAAPILYPDLSLRQAIRNLGYSGFSSFAESSLGKVFFAFSKDFVATAKLISRAFAVIQNYGQFEIEVLDERNVVLSMREVWDFADVYYVGSFEGSKSVNHFAFDTLIRRSKTLDTIDLKLILRD